MLKFSIYPGVWIFMILLLVASVTRTKKYNIINTIDSSSNYHHDNQHQRYYRQLKNSNYFFLSFTHVLQDFMSIFLNDTSVYDSLLIVGRLETSNSKNKIKYLDKSQRSQKNEIKDISTYTAKELIPNSISTINCYANNTSCIETVSTFVSNNSLQRFVKENERSRRKWVNYKWKRRTLCAFPFNDEMENAGKKTLVDYTGPVFINDIDDSDSLKPHIRVKRSESESAPRSSITYQQDYLKDLANSFPRSAYESIDENSYDDDISFDAKREIKSQEFFANDEQSNARLDESDRTKIFDVHSFHPVIPSSLKNDESAESDVIGMPSNANKINLFEDKTSNQEIVPPQESLEDDASYVNRRSHNINPEVQDFSEDPMLAVELVRRKRNNYAKRDKRNLREKASSDSQVTNDKTKRYIHDQNKKSSSLATADLKAELLRFRRRAKNNRYEKSSKMKKKKKHAGKKQNNNQRSLGSGRSKSTNRLQTPRKRKANEVKSEGKSNVGITRLVSKKNNENNFHRRSVKSKKSIERTDSKNDRTSKNVASTLCVKSNKIEDKNSADNSEHSLATRGGSSVGGSDVGDLKAGSDENANALLTQNEEQQALSENEKSVPSVEAANLRTKRNKNTEANHGFLNEEDELRYYENIREPEPESDECVNRSKRQHSMSTEVESNRAARSIEEVKELAKKLVTKVNELQNYINAEEAKGNDRRERGIETRAIDDLCSNVSNACDAFKETPKIIQKCVPSTDSKLGSPAKIVVERKVDPIEITDERKLVKEGKEKSMGKKRSVVRRARKMPSSTSRMIRKENDKPQHKWGRWTDWSSCSVTCGKGRQIRWRYCLHDCSTAETEMEEKACQLPACPPGKFLGIF